MIIIKHLDSFFLLLFVFFLHNWCHSLKNYRHQYKYFLCFSFDTLQLTSASASIRSFVLLFFFDNSTLTLQLIEKYQSTEFYLISKESKDFSSYILPSSCSTNTRFIGRYSMVNHQRSCWTKFSAKIIRR